jgi:two-component sensor histidine kinase
MPGIYSAPNDGDIPLRMIRDPGDAVEDYELVLRETHHRMKNTLMLLGAMARCELNGNGSAVTSTAVDRFERRIVAFGSLYHLLSDNQCSEVSVDAYFGGLCGALSEAILEPAGIRCEAEIDCGSMPASRCNRLALILTEVVTNAAKHAFPDKTGARVRIGLTDRNGAWFCTVTDNGIGSNGSLPGTGSRILDGLARSICARIGVEAGPSGTRVTIEVPSL